MTLSGRVTSARASHLENARLPTYASDEGKVTEARSPQRSKVYSSMAVTSGGSVMLTQLEAGLLYNLLGKLLGFRGRFKLWRMRKKLFTVASNVDPGSDQL